MKYLILILFFFVGCYSQKKAQKQFARSVANFPAIGADYCGRTYPIEAITIKGNDSVKIDTVWGTDFIRDTTIEIKVDTVRIYYTTKVPTLITKTIIRTDTIRVENKARIDLLNISNQKLLDQLLKTEQSRDKEIEYKKVWRKWALWTWFLLFVGAAGGYLLKKYKVI